MKAAYVKGHADIEIRTIESPIVESGEILVKMHSCGVCGSDLEKIYGHYTQPSMKLGHEPSATSIKSSKPTWIDFASLTAAWRAFGSNHEPGNEHRSRAWDRTISGPKSLKACKPLSPRRRRADKSLLWPE